MPVDLSVASTVGVSPDVMVVATVSPKKDDYELKDAYNTIAKLKADVAAANKSLAEKDLKIKDLERQKGVIYDDGKRKFDELYQDSRKRMKEMLVGGDEWRQHFIWKIQDDVERSRSFDALVNLGYEQGEYFQKTLSDLDNYKY